MIPALKFDLNAYMRDGNYVDFGEVFLKMNTRYSKTFMMEKFFNSDPNAVATRRRLR